jgi:hemoglobin
MKDIETRADLDILIKEFYKALLQDASISYIFTDIAGIDLDQHLPVITDFWELALFNTGAYRNNTMQIHMALNARETLTGAHFETWLGHFNTTTDSLYSGDNADKIKTRALSVATVMKIKLMSA